MKRIFPFLLFLSAPVVGTWAQGETCATAATISVNASCTTTPFTMTTNVGNEMAAPACGASNRDGWWTFTTGAGTQSVSISETTNRPIGLAVYTGCNAANMIACQSFGNAAGTLTINVTPNTTYYLRVFRTNSGSQAWTGTVCVVGSNSPVVQGCTTAGGGQYPTGTYTPTCNGVAGAIAANCWAGEYSVVAVTNGTTYTFGSSTATDFLTISNAAGTTVLASGTGSVVWPSTVTGNVRFYTHTNSFCGEQNTNRARTVQCGTPLPPPANDNCGGAVSLTPGFTCVTTAGTTVAATQSMAAVTCAGFAGNADDDVWYSFMATSTTHTVDVLGDGAFDAVVQGFSGTCGSLTSIGCADDFFAGTTESMTLTGLTIGSTYFVRVYNFDDPGTSGTFTICVVAPPPPPANDNCANATVLTVNANGACPGAGTAGNTAGAGFQGGALPVCDNVGNIQDVWYSFNSGANTTLNFNVSLGTAQNVGIEFFTACGTTATGLQPGGCDFEAWDPAPTQISGFAANTNYLFRIFTNVDFETAGTFNVCISEPIPGDVPCTATALTVATTTNPAYLPASNAGTGHGSFGAGACSLGDFANDIWFTAVVPATGNVAVALDPGVASFDPIVEIYTSSNNTCTGTFTSVACDDDGGLGDRSFAYAGGLTVGNTVFIRVSSFTAGTTGNFGIAVTDAVHWSGATSGVPTLPANWFGEPDNGSYPTASHDIRVLNVPNALAPTANFNVLDVYMNDGATVNNNGGNLRVNGNWHGASQANPANVVSPSDANFLVLLSSNGIIDGYTNAQRVRLNGTYTIAAGNHHFTISKFLQALSGVLTSNNNLTFLSDATGTAYLNDFTATYTGSVSGNIHMQRYNSVGLQGFRQLGTPVQLPNISSLQGFTPSGTAGFVIPVPTCDPNYVAFNSPYGNWMQLVEDGTPQYNCHQSLFQVLTGGGMTNGRGYYLDVPGNSTLTFTGVANTGTVSYPLTHANTAVTNGWNMVSNPYPSPLAWELLNVPVGVDAIAKIWQTSGAYLGTWQDLDPLAAGTQAVAIGQAFQVRVTVPGTSVPFLLDNLDRTTSAPTYLFAGGDPMTLNIDILGNGFADLSKVRFVDGATPDMDAQFDSPKMLGNANQPMVYSIWGGKDYSTNSFGTLTEVYSLPLGVKVAQAGQHTLQFSNVDQFPASALIYLEDTETGAAWQDVRANDTYVFTETAGIHTERFVLHFYPPVQQTVVDATCEIAGQVQVTEESPSTWNYVLTDAQDQPISQGNLDGAQTITNLPAGTYTLTLTEPTSGYVAVETVTIQGATAVTAQAQASLLTVEPGQEIQFTATTAGADAWHWNFGDLITSTEQNPQHAYNAPGTYEVVLTASNGTCSEASLLAVEVSAGTASVADAFADAGIQLWNDNCTVYLKFSEMWKGKSIFALFDAQGKQVFQHQFTDANGTQQVDCGALATGTYTVELRGSGHRVSRKLMMGVK